MSVRRAASASRTPGARTPPTPHTPGSPAPTPTARCRRHWLHTQLELAASGSQLVLGTVRPDPQDLEPGRLAHWWSRHRLRDGHPYIHGANLGFTLAAYDAAGGFRDVADGEDVDLVGRIKALGVSWAATSRMPVLTSGRLGGRAPAGFAAYLLSLAP